MVRINRIMIKKYIDNDIPPIKLPSERSFGLLFFLFFTVGGGYSLYKSLPATLTYSLFISAAALLVFTFVAPKFLAPFNRAWFSLGILLNMIVSPLVLGAIFFLLITPVAIVMRIFGRDELKLHKRDVASYWVDKNPIYLCSQSFKNQF